MKKFPKTIATKQDVDNLISVYPQKILAFLESLLVYNTIWQITGSLEDPEEGVTDETHKIHTDLPAMGMPEKYFQMEFKIDQNSKLNRMGYTIQQVEDLIESIE